MTMHSRKNCSLARFVLVALLMLTATVAQAGDKVMRVLAIGNSFSEDAIENNLYDLFRASGRKAVVANMYIGGCTLQRHWNNMKADAPAYRYRKTTVDGQRHQTDNMKLSAALADEQWDVVSLQQASGVSGKYATYTPYMRDLIAYVHKLAPRARIIWHQTWAYAKDSDHGEFPNYGRSQQAMYDSIMSASHRVVRQYKLRAVVPSGTAIQNARTSFLGDKLNRDGFHLNLTYGRYTAACTWFEVLTRRSVVGNSYAPAGLSPSVVRVCQQAAHAAVRHPYRVIDLSRLPNADARVGN